MVSARDSRLNLALILLRKLGYDESAGWVPADRFDALNVHRFALQQAREEMGVIGAFCLTRQGQETRTIITPLVFVAVADDETAAQEIHRRVWSQGLTPFLLIACPGKAAVCSGFSFTHRDWPNSVDWFGADAIAALPPSPYGLVAFVAPSGALWDLRAPRLRTSLFWRDHSIDVAGRVDQRLIDSLEALSDILIRGRNLCSPLSAAAANGLIGRFLYIYFLADRGIISQAWLDGRGHSEITLAEQHREWPCPATWAMFDDLDSIFNGSIFPLAAEERAEINASHINLVRLVMKHDAEPLRSGAVQLSFLDFYLGALRTETLSAVYEQFLENLRAGERRRSGAFYTPPFLVDFMLDRLEEHQPLTDGVSVLDPAAGSGVFLVGAYRRIIERSRSTRTDARLSLTDLRGLLVRNIYGVERNRDACHVAAFSLYLTMLDYVDPRDLTRVAAGEDSEKLFPALIDNNLFPSDFFDDTAARKVLRRADCIVGNPPWQTLAKLESPAARAWQQGHTDDAPIGKEQAAELFVWKALAEHLKPEGFLAFLLPAKSFTNPSSWPFRRELARRHTVLGAANFAHLRYRLFSSARQAVVAVVVQARPPRSRDAAWIYSPLSVGQPMARKEWPWTVVLDRADVQTVRHDGLARNPRGWFEAFMLRPIDRQVHQLLEDGVLLNRVATLQSLGEALNARISRGGNSTETGVDRAHLIDAPNEDLPEDADAHGLLAGLDGEGKSAADTLPAEQWAKVRAPYRNRFGGNVLLIPRNLKSIRVVASPTGYTSSTMALFFDKPADTVTAREKCLLAAIGRFLRSNVALYLVATIGRRWLMDRRNIEPEDLKALYVPIIDLDDARIDGILARSGAELDSYILQCLGLNGDLQRAVREFVAFRIGFQDGEVPLKALQVPEALEMDRYRDVLQHTLDGLMGRKNAFRLEMMTDVGLGVGAVGAHFVKDYTTPTPQGLCLNALAAYARSSANSFTDSLAMAYLVNPVSVTVVKPLEYFRWTVDSAFSDGQRIMSAFSKGRV
ncbi:class I SAM-dependent DNA methyltransferase [Xanthobacter oligotrophicus]|uniref:HsdM family class I SAM-dependent methyltransferase n=1 Tax=Xanthobacter oligotrophicus TaxID=2607286 RepID=UPI00165E18B1|nr:N-6 DNA methylase [Xanthobacter oligotrophicus]MCG5235314.1 SAM-dependent methyltransferase [Xanthobacter oligotrophicus]